MKSSTHLRHLKRLYESRKKKIKKRLRDFAHASPSEYFYELVYCLLTPQTYAVHADKAVERLRALKFEARKINPEEILADKGHYIRFHKTKSKHLLRLKKEMDAVRAVLSNETDPAELREWLVNNVYGLGYKEATHFLRNIGRNSGLAILDRHILRNLKRYGAINALPTTLSRKNYLSIEKKFMKFSEQVGIPVDELDLLFWSMETGEIRK